MYNYGLIIYFRARPPVDFSRMRGSAPDNEPSEEHILYSSRFPFPFFKSVPLPSTTTPVIYRRPRYFYPEWPFPSVITTPVLHLLFSSLLCRNGRQRRRRAFCFHSPQSVLRVRRFLRRFVTVSGLQQRTRRIMKILGSSRTRRDQVTDEEERQGRRDDRAGLARESPRGDISAARRA